MHVYRDTLNEALIDRESDDTHGFSFVRADSINDRYSTFVLKDASRFARYLGSD